LEDYKEMPKVSEDMAVRGLFTQSRRRKHRMLTVGVAALSVVGMTMGVSFLDSSGVTTIGITAASTNLVVPLSGSTTLPAGATPLTTTAFSGHSTLVGCTVSTVTEASTGATSGYNCSAGATSSTVTAVSPSWSPPSSGAGTVTTSGDLAIVNATTAQNYVTLNVYITNLSPLLIDYSAFALPLNVYQTTCTALICNAWAQAPVVSTTNYGAFLTDTVPEMTFVLPAGFYYDIVMEGTNNTAQGTPAFAPAPAVTGGVGGSLGVIGSNTGGALGPSFFFSASAQ
jgi:hypothetical protein